jgi:GcrA cell cycle regulator
MTWTDTKIDTITRMWAEGYASSIIGQTVGKSRNAVIGKLGRMGLMGDPKRNRARATARMQANKRRKEARVRGTVPVTAPAPVKPLRATPAPIEGILLEALTRTTCRWPVTEAAPHKFCGQHSETGRYCPHHEHRAVSPGKGRQA